MIEDEKLWRKERGKIDLIGKRRGNHGDNRVTRNNNNKFCLEIT